VYKFYLFLFVVLSSLSASASLDKELLESKKCSNIFAHFENIYNLPEYTLHSISLQETRKAHSEHQIGIVWPWTVTSRGRGYHFNNRDEAITFAKLQIDAGNDSIDVGCMQINLKYHPNAFASIEEAFSPKHNVAYGAKLLKENYDRSKNWNAAIGLYHSAQEDRSMEYQKMVGRIHASIVNYKNKLQTISGPTGIKLADRGLKKRSQLADTGTVNVK
jgi:hypothetical protein